MIGKILDYCSLTIVIIGAINWGLIGFFDFDLVAFLFGTMTLFTRIVYALVGICGIYLITAYGRMKKHGNKLTIINPKENRRANIVPFQLILLFFL